MGSRVKVVRLSDNAEYTFDIVGFAQSNPSEGKISDESPVGLALVGAKKGDVVSVEAPIGVLEYKIESID